MASAACRTRIASPEKNDSPLPPPETLSLSPRQVARTLKELCEMGLVRKFKDEYGITRYRATGVVR